jgi:hypothetical protein
MHFLSAAQVGHSLGGGVAALMAHMAHNDAQVARALLGGPELCDAVEHCTYEAVSLPTGTPIELADRVTRRACKWRVQHGPLAAGSSSRKDCDESNAWGHPRCRVC